MQAEASGRSAGWLQARVAVATLARLVMGVVFIVAGSRKIADVELAKLSVESYQILPRDIAHVVGIALPIVEIALGVLLLVGLGTRIVAVLMSVLLVAFIAAIASLWIRGINVACGCFGGSLLATERPNFGAEIGRDVLMLIATGWLAMWPRTYLAVENVLGPRGRATNAEIGHPDTEHAYDEQLSGSSSR